MTPPEERLPTRILWGFLILVILGIAAAFVGSRFGPSTRAAALPVLGTLPEFSLTERGGKTVTRADLEGRITVADFIFTSCSAQCPRVSAEMAKLQTFALPRWPRVRLISLTVDPERDTPQALAEYARGFSADPDRWWFLTGPPAALDALIRDGFRVAGRSKEPVDTSPGAILHSVSLVLLDSRVRIRGYYESTDPEEMAKLRGDLAALAGGGSLISFKSLPHLNAFLNAVSFLFLVSGYRMIRAKRIAAHRACMLCACGASVFFFISYITYHARVGSVHFPGQGWVRPAYFTLLISHTLLAATVPFLAGVTLTRALRGNFPAHRRIARWTFPVWAYVSLTGVLVYIMLYWVYGAQG
jgi:uncharacterized membrane protein YozB (DUF420 family)/cytochrome oxidase Cu insertion factor (SCO1/SenC/PrrC family)